MHEYLEYLDKTAVFCPKKPVRLSTWKDLQQDSCIKQYADYFELFQ